MVGGEPFTGTGYFKFAFTNAAGSINYWTNDGTQLGTGGDEPTDAVPLAVTNGLFSVLLGNANLVNMTEPLEAGVFADRGRQLHIWFDPDGIGPYTDLGLTVVAAVPYAFNAETLDGKDGEYYDQHYEHVVVVAKSGGDYSNVQAAIDAIADATAENPYLVWVGPGTYSETVTMKPHVHLQGAGQEVTAISSTVGGGEGYSPVRGTLVLTGYVSLRDLTVKNSGTDVSNCAIFGTGDMTATLLADVSAHIFGVGGNNSGIFLNGLSGWLETILVNVTSLAENGETDNRGLSVMKPGHVILRGGSYIARGMGANSDGVTISTGGDFLAENVIALGEGANHNAGLYSGGGSFAQVIGGTFTGRGGENAYGIEVAGGGGLEADGIVAQGLGATSTYGVYGHHSGGYVKINNSYLEGDTSAIYCHKDTADDCLVTHTRLVGGQPNDSTDLICIAVSRELTFTAGLDCP